MWSDFRYAVRTLARSPVFVCTAIGALALGIGANTAIFSMIDAVFRNPAGIDQPDRVVVARVKYEKLNLTNIETSLKDFADIRDSREIFSATAMMVARDYAFTGGGMPERLTGARVSWRWWDVFGVRPFLGRGFRPEEDAPNANRVVVLAYGTWRRLFGGDEEVLGKAILLNEEPHEVVGVMGPGFRWPNEADIWVPIGIPPESFTRTWRFLNSYFTVARLKPGVDFEQAAAYLRVLTRRLIEEQEEVRADAIRTGWSVYAVPFVEDVSGKWKTPLWMLMGAVGCVLLIACSNIAGLMLARVAGRGREIAVRSALGASRWRLIRQVLVESLVLAVCGAAAGLALAHLVVRYFCRYAEQNFHRRLDVALDGEVLLFTAGVSVLAGLLFGLIPAWRTARSDPFEMLKESGRAGSSGPARHRLRSGLVVGEVALALLLLVGAGLLLRSLSRLQQVETGFDARGVMTAALSVPSTRYDSAASLASYHRSIVERLQSIPGVEAAAAIDPIPFSGEDRSSVFRVEGLEVGPGDPRPHGNFRRVTADYFTAMRIPLWKGRFFMGKDREGAEPVVIIDENLARQYWPNQDPVGRQMAIGTMPWARIVGVVGHIRDSDLAADSGKGTYYYPLYQLLTATVSYVVKTGGDPAALSGSLRRAVLDVDPSRPVHDLQTLEERVAKSLGPRRIAVTLLGVFAALALGMAALGLYGVISYAVTQRTHEIGVRLALGATREEILRFVVRAGLRLAGTGVAFGLAAALALSRLLKSQLYEVSPLDPLTFTVVAAVLVLIAMLACYMPARRATKVDPVVALRYE